MTYAIVHTVGSISTRIEGPTPQGVMDLFAMHEARGNTIPLNYDNLIASAMAVMEPTQEPPTPPPLKWGAVVCKTPYGFVARCGDWYLTPDPLNRWNKAVGWGRVADTEAEAVAALDQCTTPPPGYQV